MGSAYRQDRAWYVIRVRGPLDPAWSARFEGFAIAPHPTGDTILSGEVIDQAAFFGMLSRVRDLGLTVISVERHERPPEEVPDTT